MNDKQIEKLIKYHWAKGFITGIGVTAIVYMVVIAVVSSFIKF